MNIKVLRIGCNSVCMNNRYDCFRFPNGREKPCKNLKLKIYLMDTITLKEFQDNNIKKRERSIVEK